MERPISFALVAIVASILVVATRFHGVQGSWKPEVLQVGGKVICQDCTKGWNQWNQPITPLKGCKVAVTCMDERRRVVYHAGDETDDGGEFEIPVSRLVDGKEIDPRACAVRLVSSPNATCDVMTDFGGGRSGVVLRRPSHVYPDLVRYTVGPFYFTSPMCEEPDTSDSSRY